MVWVMVIVDNICQRTAIVAFVHVIYFLHEIFALVTLLSYYIDASSLQLDICCWQATQHPITS